MMLSRVLRALGRRRGVVLAVAGLATGVAITGAASSIWLAGFGYALVGFAGEVWNIASVTYRQSVTPDDLLGRVMASFRVIAYGAFPLGAALGGLVADLTSLRAAFFVGAGLILALVPYMAGTTRKHGL